MKHGLLMTIRVSSPAAATFESRMLVSARRLRDLKAAPEDVEIETIEAVERTARALQEPLLSSIPADGNER